jgi:hypothetical protein
MRSLRTASENDDLGNAALAFTTLHLTP